MPDSSNPTNTPKPQKPEPTLEFTDLVTSQEQSVEATQIIPTPATPEQVAYTELSTPIENTASPEPAPLQEAVQPEPQIKHPAPAEPSPTMVANVDARLFRNPQAAAMTSHLEEFGKIPQLDHVATAPALRPNLNPAFDVFALYGMSLAPQRTASTLFGKLALTMQLDKIFSARNRRYIGVSLFSFAIFLLVFNFQTISVQLGYFLNPPQPTAPVASETPPASTNPASLADAAESAPPGNIISIPKIKVENVPIIFEQSISEQAIQKALENGVVHYAGTALPGERSNIVIVGHSSNDWWEPGNYKFIFALLEKLTVGDQIQVNYNQKKYVFEVASSKVVEPTEISVLQPTSEPQLTLITCTPPGTSWKRLIVTAKQIAPLPNAVSQQATNQESTEAPKQVALPGNAPSLFDQIKKWFGWGNES